MTRTPDPIPTFDLGLAPYLPVQALQGRLREAVVNGVIPGVVLLLEHDPVITLGSRGTEADLRLPLPSPGCEIPVTKSERGGQATLHAPGQLVSYPILTVKDHDLRAYVRDLEEILIVLLADLGIAADRRPGRHGLYVGGLKIASVGLRCRRWVASHGTSLNVNIDLSLFERIVSCGEADIRQTSVRSLMGATLSMREVNRRYLAAARKVLGLDLLPLSAISYGQVETALGLKIPTAGFEPATPGSGGQCSIP